MNLLNQWFNKFYVIFLIFITSFTLLESSQQFPLKQYQLSDIFVNEGKIRGKAECVCGTPFSTRIVGGEQSNITDIPWTVGLIFKGFFGLGASNKPFCGGTLINNLYVVTANHCVAAMLPIGIRVWLNGVVLDVEKIIKHPDYSGITLENDIALLKLSTPIPLPSDTLSPACIPDNNNNDFNGYNATVAGWGKTSFLGLNSSSMYLRKAVVPIISNEVCNRDTKNAGKVSNNMLCAGYLEGGKGPCQGDSGGPLIVKHEGKETLVGIVSHGYGCAGPNAPSVYTRVGRYTQWIVEHAKDAEWCCV